MPGSSAKVDSNLKIIALVAIFLLTALVALLFYYRNFMQDSVTETEQTSTTTETTNTKTHTSTSHNFSITYPSTWNKTETVIPNAGNAEIVLLNLTEQQSRENGKPNMIIYAGAPIDFCDSPEEPICQEEEITINGKTVKKYDSNDTDDIYYDMGGGIFIFANPNGDQAAIDAVVASFKTN